MLVPMYVNFAGGSPQRGLTRRLRRGWWGLSSHGTLTLFFRWRKRSVQKKAGGTAASGKKLLLPILTAGLVMSRTIKLGDFTFSWSALVLVFFRRQNGRAFFPLLPIAALLLRRWREAD